MSEVVREPFQPGDRFLKYEIGKLLGRGGHAFVYEATHLFLRRTDAIKIIPGPSESGRDIARRAEAEAQVLARLEHTNIVKVFDAGGTDEGLVYIVMERLVGRTLRDVLGELGRLTPAEALFITEQIARAVDAAHNAGIIHRDLKPENVFITARNVVKVLDFGIAKVLEQGAPTTQKDLLHGTVLYMSPEQLQAMRITPRSDIFSLGTMLFESLHRHPALLGETPTLQELGWIQISRLPQPLSELDPAIPRFVARFVQRAILKNPDERYASMAEVADAARATFDRLAQETLAATGVPPLIRDLSTPAGAPKLTPVARSGFPQGQTTERDPPQFTGKTEPLVPFGLRNSATPTPVTTGVPAARSVPARRAAVSFRSVSLAAAIVGFVGGTAHAVIQWWLQPLQSADVSHITSAAPATTAPPPAPPEQQVTATGASTASAATAQPSASSPAAIASTPAASEVASAANLAPAANAPSSSHAIAVAGPEPAAPVAHPRPAPRKRAADNDLWIGEVTPAPSARKPRPGIDIPIPPSALPGSGL